MNKLPWYDPKTHTAVFPIPERDEEAEAKIKAIGIRILKEVAIPLDIGVKFYRGKLPQWLKYKPEDDDGMDDGTVKYFQFYDAKDHPRVRIIIGLGCSTQVWTRYYPRAGMSVDWEIVDIQESGGWDEHIIHRAVRDAGTAQAWLDLNYPDWRNPMAYWSEA